MTVATTITRSTYILLPSTNIHIKHNRDYFTGPFLLEFEVALVNPCQSPSRSCHRNNPGDDESQLQKKKNKTKRNKSKRNETKQNTKNNQQPEKTKTKTKQNQEQKKKTRSTCKLKYIETPIRACYKSTDDTSTTVGDAELLSQAVNSSISLRRWRSLCLLRCLVPMSAS